MNNDNIPSNNNSISPKNNEFIINLMNSPMYNNNFNNMINEINNIIYQERLFNQLKEVGMKHLKDTKNVNNCLLHDLNFGIKKVNF